MLNQKSVEKLQFICKLWGTLYVFHPNVYRGDFNLNFEKTLVEALSLLDLDQKSTLRDEHLVLTTSKTIKSKNKVKYYFPGYLINLAHHGF